ncbi:MAG: ATP-binding protein [Sphaerochaetaceae bacterium]|nr:ATP-binding protein [Sphaerochaetaceae bacterium]
MKELEKLLKPSYVKNEFDCLKVNEQMTRTIMAVGYPRTIREGWLDSIISSEGNFDMSMHIKPSNISSIITQLNQELVKQESDLMAAQMKGLVNPSLKLQHQDTLNVLEKLQKGEEKLFNISLYLGARAYEKEKLDLLTKKILAELNSIMIIPKIPFLKMNEGAKALYPIQEDKLNINRNIPSDALAACFPFTTAYLNIDQQGILFGLNKINNIPIILDPFAFANYNGLILGTSGGGKSVTAKLFILRNILRGVKTIIIDPQGEYVDLTKAYNGQLVEIQRDSESIINPFDLMGSDLGEKTISLMDLFKILCGELTEVQKNILDKAVHIVYQEKGILPDQTETWAKEPPIIEDLYNEIIKEKKTASRLEKMTYEALENRLRIYVKGSFSFINKQTNLNITNDLICFNIANMPSQIKPVMMYLILDFVHKKMQKDRERKTLIIDEAWSLLRFAEHSRSIFELIKTARKFGLGIVIITQEVEDLLSSPAGKTILANTVWKYLSRQEPACIQEIAEKFHLNKEEQNYLLTSMPGEGLLFAMNDHIPLRVIPSPSEMELITTNPDEIRKREEKLKELGTTKKEDLEPYKIEKTYYLLNELNEQQTEFLKSNGFVESRLCGLDNSSKQYLVKKPSGSESIEHFFMVQIVAEEVRHYTNKITLDSTVNPDISFEIEQNGIIEKYAIEIETGSQSRNTGEMNAKVEKNNSLGYKEWWFLVTDFLAKREYTKLHSTLKRTEVKSLLEKMFKEGLNGRQQKIIDAS